MALCTSVPALRIALNAFTGTAKVQSLPNTIYLPTTTYHQPAKNLNL